MDEEEYDFYGEEREDLDDPPPLPDEEKELLFLIEFLIDTLTVKMENLKIDNVDPCTLRGENCIELMFLNFPPMNVCEKDANAEKTTGSNETRFNCGKSLIFALAENQFEESPPVFLKATVHERSPHCHRKLLIGRIKIDLTELFKKVFEKYDENPNESPVSKSIKKKYVLTGEKNLSAGEVSVYVRLTCLGQNVVTEFQKGETFCEPFLFKNKESSKVYECKATEQLEDFAQPRPGRGDLAGDRRGQFCSGGRYGGSPPDPDDEFFEEICAEINGAALCVKVEKSKRREKSKLHRVSDFCDCDYPPSEDLVEGVSSTDAAAPSFTDKRSLKEIPTEIPEGGIGTSTGNQIIFQVPPTEKLAKPGNLNGVTYNANTCKDGEKHGHAGKNSFKVISSNPENEPKLPNDPEKDVFVFRIIKRGKTNNKGKNALELEFKTPKEKIAPPPKPPYMVDREVGPEREKKEKGKGKKK